MTDTLGRRRFLIVTGGAAYACGASGPTPAPTTTPCHTPAAGPGLGYCLVESQLIRVPGAARLTVGEVVLLNVDDNTAAIVARDAQGFYALSAICTHACCLVSVCGDSTCSAPSTNPGDCKATGASPLVMNGNAFLCACHGSSFAADGSVLTGPATQPLPSVALRFDGSDALVDLSTARPKTARTPAPA